MAESIEEINLPAETNAVQLGQDQTQGAPMLSQHLLHRYMNTAENLTDAELKELRVYFRQLERALTVCPPEFTLFKREVQRHVDRLDGMLSPT